MAGGRWRDREREKEREKEVEIISNLMTKSPLSPKLIKCHSTTYKKQAFVQLFVFLNFLEQRSLAVKKKERKKERKL